MVETLDGANYRRNRHHLKKMSPNVLEILDMTPVTNPEDSPSPTKLTEEAQHTVTPTTSGTTNKPPTAAPKTPM